MANIIFDENYFVSGGDVGGYDNYNENSCSSEPSAMLADKILKKFERSGLKLAGKKVLDVGCAHGFLVKHLSLLGVEAYGMDISDYAVSQVSPEIAGRVIVGDARNEADFKKICSIAGLTSGEKFDLIIEQDMICCLGDEDAIIFCELGRLYGKQILHYLENEPQTIRWYTYHSIEEWKAICDKNKKDLWVKRSEGLIK